MQIHCVLTAKLLFTIIQKQLKRRWVFSNSVTFVRIHLLNYLHLMGFLEKLEKDWLRKQQNINIQSLFEQQYLLLAIRLQWDV